MRKVSTHLGLVGLTLLALTATARAAAAAPVAATAAPPPPVAGVAAQAPAAVAAPAAAPAPVATPAPAAVAAPAAGPAPVAVAAPAAAPAPAADPALAQPVATQRRLQFGLSLLPMGVGSFTATAGGMTSTADAAFAFGFGLSAGYEVLPGLIVGLSPQAIFNVKPREDGGDSSKQFDLMARVAYALPLVDTIAIYAEVLPGYSLIVPASGDTAKGLVLAFGAGGAMDLTDRIFANLGVGYQVGFQKRSAEGTESDVKTKYLRVALGGGVRF